MPAAVSSPIPPVLVKLGPLDVSQVADLRSFLELVPECETGPRAIRDQPERALPLLGITNNPDAQGT